VLEEDFRLASHRLAQLLVEIRILTNVGLDLVEVLESQPLRGEARGQRGGAGIAHHATHLAVEHRHVGESPLPRER
jgi:hypothetical protein